jgi:hypothetical protein
MADLYWEWTQYPNTQPRVGESMTLQLSVYDSPAGSIVTGLGGVISLSASPQGSYTGNLSVVANDLIISSGSATFECSFDSYGIYQIGAYYIESPSPSSPSPGSPYSSPNYAIATVNPDIFILNELPTISLLSPAHVPQGTTNQTVQVYGSNLYDSPTSVVMFSDPLVGGILQPRGSVYASPSPSSLTADLLDADMYFQGIKTLQVMNIFSGPNGADGYSGPLNFTVTPLTEISGDNPEALPATIEVWKAYNAPSSPFTPDITNEKFQRRYPAAQADLAPVSLAQVTAAAVVSATVGGVPNVYPKNANGANVDVLGYLLSQVVNNTAAVIPVGSCAPAGTNTGAWAVLDIHKGAYNGISFNQTTGSGSTWAPKIPLITDSRTPLILRAHKDANGAPESIVMIRKQTSTPNSGSTLSLATTTANKSWNYHFYDWKIEHSGLSAFFTAGTMNTGLGDSDLMHKGIKFVRCDAMGTWDARGLNLSADRFTISVMSDPMTGQDHFDMSGAIIPHILGNPAQDRSIRAWEVLLMQQGSRTQSCSSFWTSSPAQNRWSSLHIPLKASAGGALPAGYTSTVAAPKHWVRIKWVPTTGYSTNYYGDGTITSGPLGIGSHNLTVGKIDSSGNAVFTDVPLNGYFPAFEYTGNEWPSSGQVIGGMAHYPMVKFRYPGIYNLEVGLVDRSTGTDVPVGWLKSPNDPNPPSIFTVTVPVSVTSTGVSQNRCYAQKIASIPTVNLSNQSATGQLTTEDFVIPLVIKQTHLLHPAGVSTNAASTGGTNFNVNGVFKFVIDAVSYAAGWRWLTNLNTAGTSNWTTGIMADGVLSHSGRRVASDTTSQTPSKGCRLVYTGLPGSLRRGTVNVTITVFKVQLQFGSGTYVPSTLQLNNVQQDGTTTGTPFSFVVSVNTTTVASTPGALPVASANIDTSLMLGGSGNGNISGTPFAAGWPGNPAHPNYEPGHESLYPNNSVTTCPGMIYGGGIASKWATFPQCIDDFQWLGGNIHHSAYEHGMYLHITLKTIIKNVNFFRTGRTGFQWHNRRQENWYLGTVFPDDFVRNGPVWDPIILDGCTFRETGNEDQGADGVSIAEHAGPILISNCVFDCRFLETLKHNPSNGGMGGLVIYDGTPCKPDTISANPAGFVTNNFFYPFLVDVHGAPLITGTELNSLVHLNGCALQGPTNPGVLPHIQTLLGNSPVLKEWATAGSWRDVQNQYSSGGTWNIPFGNTATGAHLTHADNPSNNRYFGDPGNELGGSAGYWTTASAPHTDVNGYKQWPVIDGTGAIRYIGEPTYGSLHQIGSVTLINNVFLAQGNTSYPFKHPNWPSVGQRANAKISGARQLSLINNEFHSGLREALCINNRSSDLGSTPPGRVPIGWWGTCYGNRLFPVDSFTYHGIADYVGHAPIIDYLIKPTP